MSSFQAFLAATRDEPVYVLLGVQGSGTNLLSRILTRTFGFSVLRDRSMVFNAAVRLGPHPDAGAVAREIERFKRVVAPSPLRRKISKNVIRRNAAFVGIDAAFASATIRSGAEFARFIYAYRAFSQGTRLMAIKSDDLWESLEAIDAIIPNRRVVLLTRDFRDNLLSVGGKAFGPIEPLCAAQYVKSQFGRYAAEYNRAGANGCHVKFETLVTSPADFVASFAERFQLTPVVADAAMTVRLRPNKTSKWKALPQEELAWCEAILRDELLAFGYQPATANTVLPGARTWFAARTKDAVRRVPQKFRRLVARVRS